TPWALDQLTHRLGRRPNGITMLPCPTDIDRPLPPQASVEQGRGDFISVFHLQNHRRKNLKNLAKAFASIQAPTAEHSLTVIGGGDDQDVAACSKLIAGIDGASLAGRMDREPLRERMQRATALVLPSLRESFGLVFIEALFAGLPIIYPRGTAIDGYFDEYGFALAVDARDPHSIAAAMETAARSEHRLKEELGRWQTSEHASGFQRPMIARDFADGLRACLASDQTASG
ncbi:MAG: glycosyltransferase, partial [Pseudomonadota bacterium]